MENIIYAEQALHGYANGHQLLAKSCTLDLIDRKKMDELSDLSGRHNSEGFVDYYTGYPIENGEKYVISKTWYAHEMARPGCVWTHSLIFFTNDLCQLSDIQKLMDYFQRPSGPSYEIYTHPVLLTAGEEKHFPPYDIQQLQYEIFTICSSAVPKYVFVDPLSLRFENELFMVLCSLPQEILRTFTFCTMSYDDRKYGNSLFQYQMIPAVGKSGLARRNSQAQVCEEFSAIEKYPYWIRRYAVTLLRNALNPLHVFIRQYGTDYMTLDTFSKFCRLYFALEDETGLSLTEYVDSIEALFPTEQPILQKTAELVLDDNFFSRPFNGQEYMILEIMEMKSLILEKSHKNKLNYKIIRKTPEKLYPYLKRYISGALPAQICEFVEDMIQMLPYNDLCEVSSMDRNICFVMVRRNPSLLLCPDIWKQPRDFQQEMIGAINQTLYPEQLKKLLMTILQVDKENIAEDLYRVFGRQLLPALYNALRIANLPFKNQLDYWTPILLRNQHMLLEEILNLPNEKWRQELFLKLDMNSAGLAQSTGKIMWLELYHEFFKMELLDKNRIDIATQFFAAIFCTDYHFEDVFIRDIVGTVYQEVKSNTMGFDTWNRFQHILPQVEDYQAWDRCLRIRKALEGKGYPVSLVES